MLADGVPERGEILPEDVTQCVVDIDNKIASLEEGPELLPGADPGALAAVRAQPTGADHAGRTASDSLPRFSCR